ncbi:MAG: hypothetical protein Q8934_08755 [Bacillota bacterium]|nr:hypothetical protein [Bacillota bacterium]
MVYKVKKSITIDKDIEVFIEELAKQEERRFSNMINKILLEYKKSVESNSINKN